MNARGFIRWVLMYGWREVPAEPRRVPHFHINLLPEARKVSTTRALMSAYLSYLYRTAKIGFTARSSPSRACAAKNVRAVWVQGFESGRDHKYESFHPESVYLSTVIKNLETAEPLSAYSRARK